MPKDCNSHNKDMPPIYHKFYETAFTEEFQTHNSILDILPYKPEVMIIGTNNPGTPHSNFADFFYGRNYFWTGFKNLFSLNQVELKSRRMPSNGAPQAELNPTLNEILAICRKLKLTFADLICCVLHNDNPYYELRKNDNIIFNGREYNLIQDGRKDDILGLEQLEQIEQVCWNDQNIINYLYKNPTINTIYFTRKPTEIWAEKWFNIANSLLLQGRHFVNIFTPSGQGKPVFNNMGRLLNHWIHNETLNFGKLNNEWLIHNGVTLDSF